MRRLTDDAALLERALREGWTSERGELRELLERRPDWAALLEGPEHVPDVHGAVAEADRRLVDEELALVRARRPRVAAPRTNGLRRVGLPLAAALLLSLGGWLAWTARTSAPSEAVQGLGGSDTARRVVWLTSDPASAADGAFHWDASEALAEGQSYEVVVTTCADGAQPVRELARTRIQASSLLSQADTTRWAPGPEILALLPECFEWSVSLLDANGLELASARATVQRSAR